MKMYVMDHILIINMCVRWIKIVIHVMPVKSIKRDVIVYRIIMTNIANGIQIRKNVNQFLARIY